MASSGIQEVKYKKVEIKGGGGGSKGTLQKWSSQA
jgi:hypothetical protein